MAEARKQSLVHRLARRRRESAGRVGEAGPAPLPGEGIANELRQTRQALGRNVARVADDLKIRRVYLQAIEEGRFDDLPGATYAVGFVRAYSDYLGLDSVEVVGRFKQEVDGLNERMRLVFPTPVPESKIPSGVVILISVVLVALAYGGWYYFSSRDADVAGQVPEVPENLESLVSEPSGDDAGLAAGGVTNQTSNLTSGSTQVAVLTLAEPGLAPGGEGTAQTGDGMEAADAAQAAEASDAAAEPAEGAPEAADGTEAANTLETTEPGLAAQPETDDGADAAREPAGGEPGGEPMSVATAPLPDRSGMLALNGAIPEAPETEALLPDSEGREPRIFGVENGSARIVLRARLDSWVQVRDQEDSLLLTRVLQPGDSYRVPDQTGLTLLTGNAGGLEIQVDGNAAPPLGPVGAVRRDIALDPDRLLAGTASSR